MGHEHHTHWQRRRRPVGGRRASRSAFRFVVVATLILGATFIACTCVPAIEEDVVPVYMSFVARSANGVLASMGMRVERRGPIIESDEFVVSVDPVCGAIEVMAVFTAAVMAYPSTWRRKWTGLGVGLSVLYTVNVLRIAALFVIGARFPSLFSEAHFVHAQALMLVAAAGLFAMWVCRASNHRDVGHDQIRA